jgi:hypothetical protein
MGTAVGARNPPMFDTIIIKVLECACVATGVSFLCTFLIFPRCASWDLTNELHKTLQNVAEMVELSATTFLQKSSPTDKERLIQLRSQTNQNFSRISIFANNLRVELSYGHLSPKDYMALTNASKQLLQHTWSMVGSNLSKVSP